MELLSYITSKVKLDLDVCADIAAAFKTESYSKGSLLIKPGSFTSKVYFIEKGLIRTFYYKDERDITQFFFDAGSFTTPLNSVFYGKPEPYGWEALEDSIVKVIPYHELEAMSIRIPALQQMLFHAAIDTLNIFAIKLESLQFQTAEQRYSTMMEMYPEILLRAPLGLIASYLGITQQTLSVIRARR
ncbi:Crp/Fnr family transcriptional regulator [Ohtaekwangia koreensis]|uniref:cAMP-binding domain of CRP or a regulatory subunit of cAMP-dependent protein kinases n=1 Tax=Ohtaekwangia koreensis TaxID=688867 RepID=A0A1T5JLW2_9BACT|nr:Crp/Fnr family transcriptional regulator [Ohtaekwangia koreensis]SKC52123.1 cAMP-binding domain of CRP or a regulatory subunit of cAMP-dependent protein kinases [Ohtaekwangia koreensis]